MSIIYSNQEGWFVSHLTFLEEVYFHDLNMKDESRKSDKQLQEDDVGNSEKELMYVMQAYHNMFDIQSPFLKDEQFAKLKDQAQNPAQTSSKPKKRKRIACFIDNDSQQDRSEVKLLFTQFLEDMKLEKSRTLLVPLKSNCSSISPISQHILPNSSSVPLHSPSMPLNTPSIPLISPSMPLNTVSDPLNSTSISLNSTSFPLNSPSIPMNTLSDPINSSSISLNSPSISLNSPSIPLNTLPFPHTAPSSISSPYCSISLAIDNNQTARKQCSHVYNLMRKYFESEDTSHKDRNMVPFQGENEMERVVKVEIKNPHTGVTDHFILPPRCKFYNWNIHQIYQTHLLPEEWTSERFDFVLLDPPWSNKFVRRKKRQKVTVSNSWYNTMDSVTMLSRIPMAAILNSLGLVAVWCTNNPTHVAQLTGTVFSAWGLRHVATWYWVKVTKYQDPVLDFSPAEHAKQPYERLLFAVPDSSTPSDFTVLPENKKIIVSVPSAVHSHKPPLTDILRPYLPQEPRCLELFARSLTPGYSSLGNQVLAFQFESLYR